MQIGPQQTMVRASDMTVNLSGEWRDPAFTPDIVNPYQWHRNGDRAHALVIWKGESKAPARLCKGIMEIGIQDLVAWLTIAGIMIAQHNQTSAGLL